MLFKRIEEELKIAVRDGFEDGKIALRNIKVQIEKLQCQNRLDRKKEPEDDLVVQAIRKEIKELEHAIEMLPNKCELHDNYVKWANICKGFLPKEKDQVKDVTVAVDTALKELGSNVRQNQLIGHVMKNNKGLPGSLVRQVVIQKLKSEGK